MDIQKIYSDPWDGERYYSVFMDEDELALFSEYQKEFASNRVTRFFKSLTRKGRKALRKENRAAYKATREANRSLEEINQARKLHNERQLKRLQNGQSAQEFQEYERYGKSRKIDGRTADYNAKIAEENRRLEEEMKQYRKAGEEARRRPKSTASPAKGKGNTTAAEEATKEAATKEAKEKKGWSTGAKVAAGVGGAGLVGGGYYLWRKNKQNSQPQDMYGNYGEQYYSDYLADELPDKYLRALDDIAIDDAILKERKTAKNKILRNVLGGTAVGAGLGALAGGGGGAYIGSMAGMLGTSLYEQVTDKNNPSKKALKLAKKIDRAKGKKGKLYERLKKDIQAQDIGYVV